MEEDSIRNLDIILKRLRWQDAMKSDFRNSNCLSHSCISRICRQLLNIELKQGHVNKDQLFMLEDKQNVGQKKSMISEDCTSEPPTKKLKKMENLNENNDDSFVGFDVEEIKSARHTTKSLSFRTSGGFHSIATKAITVRRDSNLHSDPLENGLSKSPEEVTVSGSSTESGDESCHSLDKSNEISFDKNQTSKTVREITVGCVKIKLAEKRAGDKGTLLNCDDSECRSLPKMNANIKDSSPIILISGESEGNSHICELDAEKSCELGEKQNIETCSSLPSEEIDSENIPLDKSLSHSTHKKDSALVLVENDMNNISYSERTKINDMNSNEVVDEIVQLETSERATQKCLDNTNVTGQGYESTTLSSSDESESETSESSEDSEVAVVKEVTKADKTLLVDVSDTEDFNSGASANEDMEEEEDPLVISNFLSCSLEGHNIDPREDRATFAPSQNYQLNCQVKVMVKKLRPIDITSTFCYLNKLSGIAGINIRRQFYKNKPAPMFNYHPAQPKAPIAPPPPPPRPPRVEDILTHSLFAPLIKRDQRKFHNIKPKEVPIVAMPRGLSVPTSAEPNTGYRYQSPHVQYMRFRMNAPIGHGVLPPRVTRPADAAAMFPGVPNTNVRNYLLLQPIVSSKNNTLQSLAPAPAPAAQSQPPAAGDIIGPVVLSNQNATAISTVNTMAPVGGPVVMKPFSTGQGPPYLQPPFLIPQGEHHQIMQGAAGVPLMMMPVSPAASGPPLIDLESDDQPTKAIEFVTSANNEPLNPAMFEDFVKLFNSGLFPRLESTFCCEQNSELEIDDALDSVAVFMKALIAMGFPQSQLSLMNVTYQLLLAQGMCCAGHVCRVINSIIFPAFVEKCVTDLHFNSKVKFKPLPLPDIRLSGGGTMLLPTYKMFILKRFVFAVDKVSRNILFPLPTFSVPKESPSFDKITVVLMISPTEGLGPGLVVFPHAVLNHRLRLSLDSFPDGREWSIGVHQSGGLTQSMILEFLRCTLEPYMMKDDSHSKYFMVDWWWCMDKDVLGERFNRYKILNLQQMYTMFNDPLDVALGISMQRQWGVLVNQWNKINGALKEENFPEFFIKIMKYLCSPSRLLSWTTESGLFPMDSARADSYNQRFKFNY